MCSVFEFEQCKRRPVLLLLEKVFSALFEYTMKSGLSASFRLLFRRRFSTITREEKEEEDDDDDGAMNEIYSIDVSCYLLSQNFHNNNNNNTHNTVSKQIIKTGKKQCSVTT